MSRVWRKRIAVVLSLILLLTIGFSDGSVYADPADPAVTEPETGDDADTGDDRSVLTASSLDAHGQYTIYYNLKDQETEIPEGDFKEDGSYTISIPEECPVFPYEIQFIKQENDDRTIETRWFDTPDDEVEVYDHTFKLSVVDVDKATILSVTVGDETIYMRPQEKTFTTPSPTSRLKLKAKSFMSNIPYQPISDTQDLGTVDLSGMSPLELSRVSVVKLGNGQLSPKVASWKLLAADLSGYTGSDTSYNNDYDIVETGTENAYLNLSQYCVSTKYEFVLSDDQLNPGEKSYTVTFKLSGVEDYNNWLMPSAFQNVNGSKYTVKEYGFQSKYVSNYNYNISNYDDESRIKTITTGMCEDIDVEEHIESSDTYISLKVAKGTDKVKAYLGKFDSADSAAASGKEITTELLGTGYPVKKYDDETFFTLIGVDASGKSTGTYVPFCIYLSGGSSGSSSTDVSVYPRIYLPDDYGKNIYQMSNSITRKDSGEKEYVYSLYKEYEPTGSYGVYFNVDNDTASAIYAGNYESITAANAAEAENLADKIGENPKSTYTDGKSVVKGYPTYDFSNGQDFTIFVKSDETKARHFKIKTVAGTAYASEKKMNSGAMMFISNLKDGSGNDISNYKIAGDEDSYGSFQYLTIMVPESTDLAHIKPEFKNDYKSRVYRTGSSKPEESGVSEVDFSKGAVQYSVAAEDGNYKKNFWVSVVKQVEGSNKVYINSFSDSMSETTKSGDTYNTKREVVIDKLHGINLHDILLLNIGSMAISKPVVELTSDQLVLDGYWTLNGKTDLSAFDFDKVSEDDRIIPNAAKIRLKLKDSSYSGDISGTLLIKSGDTVLVNMALTGTAGEPSIITEQKDIPDAVLYVPYGTMIQDNNKYDWNHPSYTYYGKLPEGMTVRPNGELYGVPKETGTFTFTVVMTNSSNDSSSSKQFTITVIENTDSNVDNATDKGDYYLTQKVHDNVNEPDGDSTGAIHHDIYRDTNQELYVMRSNGTIDKFVAVYLDGDRLTEGVDYEKESGSTILTIKAQTIKSRTEGRHTLGMEFRESETSLKRAAQNYYLVSGSGSSKSDDNKSSSDSDSGSSSSGSSGGSASASGSSSSGSSGGSASASSGSFPTVAANAIVVPTSLNTGVPAPVTYTIQSGDSLWKIAVKFYGTGALWQKIYRDNASVIINPDRIRAGQVITIYYTDGAYAIALANGATIPIGVAPAMIPVAANANSATIDPIVLIAQSLGKSTYTAKRGDSLWKIAGEQYGNHLYWIPLYYMNRAYLSSPRALQAGQTLILP